MVASNEEGGDAFAVFEVTGTGRGVVWFDFDVDVVVEVRCEAEDGTRLSAEAVEVGDLETSEVAFPSVDKTVRPLVEVE